ncbi:ABC transporter ATP-binding protein [Roseibium sp.]|uniref:ABC transporter ATP-binding protein n=1 Tax=Roseibium sp. TaxID=1936156 RepID=UPI003D0D90C4
MSACLTVENVTAGYGGPPVIEDISLEVQPGEIAVILGPNGAGKSTLLKTIFALTRVSSGSIRLGERELTGCATSELVPLGVSAVPQVKNVFSTLSVEENLDVGTYAAPPRDKAATREKVLSLFPDLQDKLKQPAGELSGGQRQMVAMGRALMSDPKLVLLDEPTAGLSPAYLERIFDLLLDIRKTGITILMVEQNARQALQIADHGHILVNGRNYASGTGKDLLADEDVRRLFLGGAAA